MSETPQVTQETFVETPYSDESWEIVGAPPSDQQFIPVQLAVIPTQRVGIDPMFADYGGRTGEEIKQRWHLPDEAAQRIDAQQGAEEEEANTVKIAAEELERVKQEAFAAGEAAAKATADEVRGELVKAIGTRLDAVVEDMKKQVAEKVAEIEQNAVALALSIAQKLIGQAVEINPEYIVEIVAEATKAAGGAEIRRVRVSPEDLEFIEVVGMTGTSKEQARTWTFEKDDTIKGGCIVDTSAGEIDFRLDKAWERIRDNVLKACSVGRD